MKRLYVLLLIILPLCLYAQSYQHIGVENGLSSRKVYFIQQDQKGYMWFLTQEGIDRYNGKEFKQYILNHDGRELSSLQDLSWLHVDKENNLWVIGRKGKAFRYDAPYDRFQLEYQVPDSLCITSSPVSCSYIDNNNRIWFPCSDSIHIYDINSKQAFAISQNIEGEITAITQQDSTHYFIGTELGIHHVEFKDNQLFILPEKSLNDLYLQVNDIYYDKRSDQLFIGTFQKGIYILDVKNMNCINPDTELIDVSVTRIKPLNETEMLVATDGGGIHKLNILTHQTSPYIVANYNADNMMTGNSINDIYIDKQKRIWIANYPIGITIRDDRYSQHTWYKHSLGNVQSLINDRVNGIIEDSDGDIWFATNNGVSLYLTKTKEWKSFISSFNGKFSKQNNVFLSLCEAVPGVILAGGFSSHVYIIQKNDGKVTVLPFDDYYQKYDVRPDKYIHAIIKDSYGDIWIGGHYNLKRINIQKEEIRRYPHISSVTNILEKDRDEMWIGTTKGLFLLNKESGDIKPIPLGTESNNIYSLCQTKDGKLFIGTNGSGLLIYDQATDSLEIFNKANSALLSNNIYTLLTDGENNIVFSTESGLSRYYPENKTVNMYAKDSILFHNWTKEQGLRTNHFNQNSGTIRKNGNFIFGSSEGAVEFEKTLQLPRDYNSTMVFSDFKLFYESVYPGDPKSPLQKDIDKTDILYLNNNQNIFSLKVSSINYDYPSNILYSWRLKGFYDTWTKPSPENIIRFTNLNSGRYTLEVRAISNENKEPLETRSIDIIVRPPFWKSGWAIMLYILLIALMGIVIFRLFYLRKQSKIADEKFQFFVNTAHDIRTPLTLIKAPLEDIKDREEMTIEGQRNMNTAIRNINILLRLTTNLLNFERLALYSSNLYVAEFELNSFITDIMRSFYSYADVKRINFNYSSNFKHLNVWFDREKMDSILKNIISNALKYTPENGSVDVYASATGNSWSVEVKDTGIGIPANEQKKIFKTHFRGSNAINSKITGTGIGMVLVGKMVKFHKGKIYLNSVENKGTTIRVTFPSGYEHFDKAHLSFSTEVDKSPEETETPLITKTFDTAVKRKRPAKGQRILIAEDNPEMRGYLVEILSNEYSIVACENGKKALNIVKEFNPDLVISDIIMPEMCGDQLCSILKNDIDTSHIPVMLLTALDDDKNKLKGIQTGADEYLIKPFNIGILKATISNLLTNRAILRSKFANLDIKEEEAGSLNCTSELDFAFINKLKEHVEENISDPEFKIDVLASLMNMSRTSMYSKIKALTDLTPSDYVRNIRLNRAAQLLKESQHNVTEVAELTGFSDAKYFREVFKKHYKVSPSKYKGES